MNIHNIYKLQSKGYQKNSNKDDRRTMKST